MSVQVHGATAEAAAPLPGRVETHRATSATIDPLPESASLLLDAVRFGLCLLVLLGHTTLSLFQTGWPPLMILANDASPDSLCSRASSSAL